MAVGWLNLGIYVVLLQVKLNSTDFILASVNDMDIAAVLEVLLLSALSFLTFSLMFLMTSLIRFRL